MQHYLRPGTQRYDGEDRGGMRSLSDGEVASIDEVEAAGSIFSALTWAGSDLEEVTGEWRSRQSPGICFADHRMTRFSPIPL